jgi:hypothetical protein
MKNNSKVSKPMSWIQFICYALLLQFSLIFGSGILINNSTIDCAKAKSWVRTPQLTEAIEAPFSSKYFGLETFKGIFALEYIANVAPGYILRYLFPWIELVGYSLLYYILCFSTQTTTRD